MKQVKPGIFAVEEPFPCSPKDLVVRQYAMTGVLNRMEEEEMAARILSFSQWNDQWVGVTLELLTHMFQQESEVHQEHSVALTTYHAVKEQYERELHEYYWKCLWTLGVYTLFTSKPQAPTAPAWYGPASIIQIYGPQAAANGLRNLADNGWVKYIEADAESGAEHIFVPLPALIERIMQMQNTPVAA